MLNLYLGGVCCLLVPCESATGGQEGLVGLGTHQYALQGICLLLGRYAVATFNAQALPTAPEGYLVALVVGLGHVAQLCAYGYSLGAVGSQSLQLGREYEVGCAGLQAFGSAV